jgi:hypothetical protein
LFANIIDLDKLESYDLEDADRKLIDKEVIKTKFRLLGLFGQEYNIIVYIYKSSTRMDYFRKLVGRMILINNRMR